MLPNSTNTELQPDEDDDLLADGVRFTCRWHGLVFNFWFHLDQTGEVLCKSIKHAIGQRGSTIDRVPALLVLTRDRAISPDSPPHLQPLSKERLESDWEGTLQWLKKNSIKSQGSYQVHGTIIDTSSPEALKSLGDDFKTGTVLDTVGLMGDTNDDNQDVGKPLVAFLEQSKDE
jgi:hypothetical protein